jgi:redox-sensitive bicupin YhaK (pirin superfamily)
VAQVASIDVAWLDPEMTVDQPLPAGHGGSIYLIEGAVDLNGERLTSGDAAYLPGDGPVCIRAQATSELLLVDTPLH